MREETERNNRKKSRRSDIENIKSIILIEVVFPHESVLNILNLNLFTLSLFLGLRKYHLNCKKGLCAIQIQKNVRRFICIRNVRT